MQCPIVNRVKIWDLRLKNYRKILKFFGNKKCPVFLPEKNFAIAVKNYAGAVKVSCSYSIYINFFTLIPNVLSRIVIISKNVSQLCKCWNIGWFKWVSCSYILIIKHLSLLVEYFLQECVGKADSCLIMKMNEWRRQSFRPTYVLTFTLLWKM